jgi:hypothetical protein
MAGQSCRFAHSLPASAAMLRSHRKTTSLRSLFESQGGAADHWCPAIFGQALIVANVFHVFPAVEVVIDMEIG